MKVQVKPGIPEQFIGFFEHVRRRPGDVFSIPDTPRRAVFPGEQREIERNPESKAIYEQIKDRDGKIPSAFSFRWMEPVAAATPERITTAQQALDERSTAIKQEKAGQRALDAAGETTSKDVI